MPPLIQLYSGLCSSTRTHLLLMAFRSFSCKAAQKFRWQFSALQSKKQYWGSHQKAPLAHLQSTFLIYNLGQQQVSISVLFHNLTGWNTHLPQKNINLQRIWQILLTFSASQVPFHYQFWDTPKFIQTLLSLCSFALNTCTVKITVLN